MTATYKVEINQNLLEEMEYYLTNKHKTAMRLVENFRKTCGKDESFLQIHKKVVTEIQGILDFLEIIYGLEEYSDEYGYYHLRPKEYYQ